MKDYRLERNMERANQFLTIEQNIHIIEKARNYLGFCLSDMAHAFDMLSDDLCQIYSKYYPEISKKTSIDKTENQRKNVAHYLLDHSNLPISTIGHIMRLRDIYKWADVRHILPNHRLNTNSNQENKPICFSGNKKNILLLITKMKKLRDSFAAINDNFDCASFIKKYIRSENEYYKTNKEEIAKRFTNFIMGYESKDNSKMKLLLNELKNENERHDYVINELEKLSNKKNKIENIPVKEISEQNIIT